MPLKTPSSPHFHGPNTVTKVMMWVVLALIPAYLVQVTLFGPGILINLLLTTATALLCEALMLTLRRRPLAMFLSDGSALVTAMLIALALPPLAPWWLPVIGTAFGIIFAKHLYGGLGYNPFNPAMVAYVLLLISFPIEMTTWPATVLINDELLGVGQSLALVFSGTLPEGLRLDAITMATPLDTLKTQLGLNHSLGEIVSTSNIYGRLGGTGWEWVNLAILAGGLLLIWRRVISWHVPVAMLGSLGGLALLFNLIDSNNFASPLFHIFTGGALLGAFFIATDPVSGAATPKGKLFFGAGVGILTYAIRTWGGYPDAVAFAVLMMNMAAPTIDHYTQPRVFGRTKGGKPNC